MHTDTIASRATRRAWWVGLLLAMAWIPAWASSSFGYDAEPFDVQFVGYKLEPDYRGMIEVGMAHGPQSLPLGSYRLTSYVYGRSLRVEFVNKDDPMLPPSFVLSVSERKAVMKTGGNTYYGVFRWTDAGD
ncbi:MAG: hypothetical protein ABL934_11675 [Lysobacteraceae bacterium]